jgi:hypothetical protein
LGSLIFDFCIIAFASGLAFYQALNSISITKYAGAGFQNNNSNLLGSLVILAIFFFGVFRLVIDLRSREEF